MKSIIIVKISLKINKNNVKKNKLQKTCQKYIFASSLVGQTTCFNSLKESFINCILFLLNIKKATKYSL